jgi:hypothetical protein
MRKSLCGLFAAALVVGLTANAQAHIDVAGAPFLLFEMGDADLAAIDIKDGTLSDWDSQFGVPSLVATDFYADPTVGDGAQYDPNDLDFRIYLGWTRQNRGNHIFVAIERVDDVYINEYEGGNPGSLWTQDAIEFMVDGDHTGGQYGGWPSADYTAEELLLINNQQAQQYEGIPESPDGLLVGYLGAGTTWVNLPPYADGGGAAVGTSPTVSVVEWYLTPYDNLIWNDPAGSVQSTLIPDKIIGFQISVPDFDTEPRAYHAFHTLSGQAETFRYAERFVDGILVGSDDVSSAVESSSWAQIKGSFAR